MATNFYSIDDLAQGFKQSPFRVSYAIKKARIHPAGHVGTYRIFSRSQLPAIKAALSNVRVHHVRGEHGQ